MRARPRLVAAVTFAAAIGWLLAPSLFGGKVLSPADLQLVYPPFRSASPGLSRPANPILGDAAFDFEPDLINARSQVRAGILPIWDQLVGAGRPLLASEQAGPLYPPNALAYAVPYWPSLAWIGALKLLIACLGAFALCRALRLGLAASVLGGLGFGLGDAMVVFLSHPHTAVGGLLPWGLFFVERLVRSPSPGGVAGLGLCLGVALLGGHPETEMVVAIAVVAYAIFRGAWARRRAGARSIWRGSAACIALGLGVAVAIGAISVIPFFELVANGGHVSRAGPIDSVKILAGVAFPELWGRSDKVVFAGGPTNGFAASALYVGTLPLLLAIAGFVRRSAYQWFFVGLGLLAVALMLDTPVHSALAGLPGLKNLNFHWFFWWLFLALAVLGAFGAHLLIEGDAAARRKMLFVLAGVAVVATIAWPITHTSVLAHVGSAFAQLPSVRRGERSTDVVQMASVLRFALLALVLLAAGVLLLRVESARRIVGPLLVVVTAVDLLTIDAGFQPQIPKAQADPRVPASIRFLEEHARGQTVIGSGAAMQPNTAERYGLRDAGARDLPELKRHAELFRALGGISVFGLGDELFDLREPRAMRLLDVFSVRYVVDDGTEPLPRRLRVVYASPGQRVTANPSAFPRAWVAYDWRPAAGESDALRLTRTTDPQSLERAPVIEHAPPARAGPAQRITPASITQDNSAELTVDATASHTGYVVFDDSLYPGWDAQLDGHPTPILAANTAFRAVAIPAGRHRITFRYRPASVLAGTILTLLGVAVAAGLLIISVVSRGRRRSASLSRDGLAFQGHPKVSAGGGSGTGS